MDQHLPPPNHTDGSSPPRTVDTPTPEQTPTSPAKNPAAVLLGGLGGKKGGPARAKKLSPQQRSAIARKAARARWAKRRQA
jgi:hypothetical protein